MFPTFVRTKPIHVKTSSRSRLPHCLCLVKLFYENKIGIIWSYQVIFSDVIVLFFCLFNFVLVCFWVLFEIAIFVIFFFITNYFYSFFVIGKNEDSSSMYFVYLKVILITNIWHQLLNTKQPLWIQNTGPQVLNS